MSLTKENLLQYTGHCTQLHKPEIALLLQLRYKTMAQSHINHRMVDLVQSSTQARPPVVQVCVWTAFEYLQRWGLLSLSRQLVAELGNLMVKKCFLVFSCFSCFLNMKMKVKLDIFENGILHIFIIILFPLSSFPFYWYTSVLWKKNPMNRNHNTANKYWNT